MQGSAGEGTRPRTPSVRTARLMLVYAGGDSTPFPGVACVPPGRPLRRACSLLADSAHCPGAPSARPGSGQSLGSARPLGSARLPAGPCVCSHERDFLLLQVKSRRPGRGLAPGLRSRASAGTTRATSRGTRSATRVTGFSLPLSSRWPPHLGNGGEDRPRPVQASKYLPDTQP